MARSSTLKKSAPGAVIRAARESLRAVWASYLGHFLHANSRRLVGRFYQRFPWLAEVA